MELLEFREKVFEILNCKNTSEIGNRLLAVVTENNSTIFEQFESILTDEKDWLQALWQYYEADRAEKKQDYTPKSLCSLVSALAGECKSVYDCCGGSGALTLEIVKKRDVKDVYIEELDKRVIPFLLFNLAMQNVSGYVVNGDVLSGEATKAYRIIKGEKYSNIEEISPDIVSKITADVAVSNPPYNIKWNPPLPIENDGRFPIIPPASNANWAFVFNCLSKANKAVLILPNGILSERTEQEIRKYFVDNDLIDTVIIMPGKMFEVTSISTCVLVINKHKKNNGIVRFIDSRKNCIVEEREQRGQFGGASHTNRVYKKAYNVLTNENIEKILNAPDNQFEFSATVTNEEISKNEYTLIPSRYIEFMPQEQTHRAFQDIADNINHITQMQNACKLVINETIATRLGLDVEALKKDIQQSKELAAIQSTIGINLESSDYIQFTKNKNEMLFKCNDKEILPDMLLQAFTIWKNQIALLNTMQNQYLAELREALLPDLMSGKINLG